MDYILRHERLDAYRLICEVANWVRDAKFPRGDSDLKDQARRASRSAGLNLAEGAYRDGKARLYHFRIAAGSASECCSALDFVILPGVDEQQAKLRRVVAMIGKLR